MISSTHFTNSKIRKMVPIKKRTSSFPIFCGFLCVHTQEGEGLIVPGTERHACLFEVRTGEDVYVHLRQLWVFITTENVSLVYLTRKMVPIPR